MSTQNLIIYKLKSLHHILEELNLDLNFKIIFVENESSLKVKEKELHNYLVISDKKYSNHNNYFILENSPINFFKLLEKLNVQFLKMQFYNHSEIKINRYTIDVNSRKMINSNTKLKLTEKEINIITYLIKSKIPVTVSELKKMVWSYQTDIETHTVETHIYRLRKKILNTFHDSKFINSEKNGYQINQEKPPIKSLD